MAAEEAATNTDAESGEHLSRHQEDREQGWLTRNGRRRPTSKKLMLRRSTVIATVTTMVTVGTGKTSYGALSGWVTHLIYGDGLTDFFEWCERSWRRRRSESSSADNNDDAVCSNALVVATTSRSAGSGTGSSCGSVDGGTGAQYR